MRVDYNVVGKVIAVNSMFQQLTFACVVAFDSVACDFSFLSTDEKYFVYGLCSR